MTPVPPSAHADVCIVGGGVAGLTTAYLLLREGRSVVVLDHGPLAGGESGRTTAHLSNAIDDRYVEMERIHGTAGARLAANSHTAAIERIARIVRDETIACDFQRLDGYLISAVLEPQDVLEQELAAAHRAGLESVEWLPTSPLPTVQRPCLRFPGQGQIHPTRYLTGLAKAVRRLGGQLYTGARVTNVEGGNRAQILVDSGPIVTAGAVVVATNTPINDRFTIHTKQAAYRTYAFAAPIPRGAVPVALYWDTVDPYHYVRLQPRDEQSDFLIVGGEDHKTGQAQHTERRHDVLVDWARHWFPMMGPIEFAWSGQVMETVDGLGFIGRNPGDASNVYIATGDSGMGMTHGTIAGMLLTDLICERANPWAGLYDPARTSLRAIGEYASENVNVAAQYVDWVRSGDVDSVDEIGINSGAVVRKGAKKLAVYRDERGELHTRSAVCPHLNCIVQWNAKEHSWDCPCHGSRFDRFGTVVNGPAMSDLEPVE